MPVELISWLAAAVTTLAGAALGLAGSRYSRVSCLVATGLGLVGALVGLGWRTLGAGAWTWPGATPADALALLAAGALIVMAWSAARGRAQKTHKFASALALAGAAALLVAASWLAWRTPSSTPAWTAQAWLFGVRCLLAAIGLGGWLVAFAVSLPWAIGAAHARPAEDPGRAAALVTFPWLTAALLAGVLWQLAVRATPWGATSAALWEGAAWLLAVIYLHYTSNWRPVRQPAWPAAVLAGLVFIAGVVAALQANSWLL